MEQYPGKENRTLEITLFLMMKLFFKFDENYYLNRKKLTQRRKDIWDSVNLRMIWTSIYR